MPNVAHLTSETVLGSFVDPRTPRVFTDGRNFGEGQDFAKASVVAF